MAPQTKVEFVTLRMIFLPPTNPCIVATRRNRALNSYVPQVRQWFNRTIVRERTKLCPCLEVSFCEWTMSSSEARLFTVNGIHFDKIIVVFGEDAIHWVYYQNALLRRRIEGQSALLVKFCGCCLDTHYLSVIETIHKSVLESMKVV